MFRFLLIFLAIGGFSLQSFAADDAVAKDDDTAVASDVADNGEHDGEHEHSGDEAGHDGEDGTHGDDHKGHDLPPLLSLDPGSAICNLLIFLGVFAILAKFAWPPILEGLKAREQKIHGDLMEAQKRNEEAKALLGDYQKKIDDAAAQVQDMLADARKDAEAAGQRIVAEAKEESDRQRDRAMADIDSAKKAALAELADQTGQMAIGVAKQVVGRELKTDDHADLIRASLDRLPSQN